jgi:hypothetical protein
MDAFFNIMLYIPEPVRDELKGGTPGKILNRKHGFKNSLQPNASSLFGWDTSLQKPLK